MSARVYPFPLVRRQGLAWRQACRMADLRPNSAERHLQQQLRVQAETMARRGISADLIEVQLREYESAIRAALFSVVLNGGAA